ncbi:hypothetical protein OTK51_04470 [Vibrio scophthalmi]|uniref:hypothetical protein n=1 Tax=Vibrio scophthalmi TaxID=45658 RepID=UPI002283734A|nr:hypothetical protein [Vibrio scophthalmi]MCY9802682.1 hypothetical protein [Vibrio scophthalmi]
MLANNLKHYLSVAVVLFVLGSIGANIVLFNSLQNKNIQLGVSANQLDGALQTNTRLTEQVDLFDDERYSAQLAADAMQEKLAEYQQAATLVNDSAQKELKHEPCTTVPIPDSIEWLYYH